VIEAYVMKVREKMREEERKGRLLYQYIVHNINVKVEGSRKRGREREEEG
jgi:hypothetical protein